jgi:hypothetical protein
MSVDWGYVFFLIWFGMATIGVLILVLLIAIIHLNRPRIFDAFYLKSPHFNESERRKIDLDLHFRVMLTLMAMALISFPNLGKLKQRRLGDIKSSIPLWYRALILITYAWMSLCLIVVFGSMLIYRP